MLIAGAGYIANEFAGIFNEFGSKVTLINRSDVILRGYDESIRDRLLQISMTKGIDFRFHANFRGIEQTDDGLKVEMTNHEPMTVDCVLFATGRVPNTDRLGSKTRASSSTTRARSRSMPTAARASTASMRWAT